MLRDRTINTSDRRTIRASLKSSSLTKIRLDKTERLAISEENFDQEFFARVGPCHNPRKPSVGATSASCRCLFVDSVALGWTCPETVSGDFLVSLGIPAGFYLVLRKHSPDLYEIIGQANLHPNLGLQNNSQEVMPAETYIYLDEFDFVIFAAPVLLDAGAEFDSVESLDFHYERPGVRVTCSRFSSFVLCSRSVLD